MRKKPKPPKKHESQSTQLDLLKTIGITKLRPHENNELYRRFLHGDLEAKSELLRQFARLFIRMAADELYKSNVYTQENHKDVFQEMLIYANKILDRKDFDPSKAKLISYVAANAKLYAKNYITLEIKRSNSNTQALINKYVNLQESHIERTGGGLSLEQAAKKLGVNVRILRWALDRSELNSPRDIEEIIDTKLEKELLPNRDRSFGPTIPKSLLHTLNYRERKIITLRFGLSDEGEKTLKEVGQRLKIGKERVRQLEAIALKKLRNAAELKKLKLDDFI